MNPAQMYYAQALRAQRQEQQQPNPLDAAYNNLRQIGMGHQQALDTINAHMQSQPMAKPMQQGDQLTNNVNLQFQGHGSGGGGQYIDGAAHD